MRLVAVNQENRDYYKYFENAKDLSFYMSRIYPDTESPYLKWMYIEENQHFIGSIWLEGKDTHWVKLGIFLADPAYRDKGIGRQAIQEMIALAKSDGVNIIALNVRGTNARARKVYAACGFQLKQRFTKENGIEAFSMELEL